MLYDTSQNSMICILSVQLNTMQTYKRLKIKKKKKKKKDAIYYDKTQYDATQQLIYCSNTRRAACKGTVNEPNKDHPRTSKVGSSQLNETGRYPR